MTDDTITLRLSRDDAEVLSEAVRYSEELDEATVDRLLAIITAALAAPAEGPERAATGETLVRCGRCGVPFPPHPDPARFDHDFCEECLPEAVKHWGLMHTAPERLAAIGGGGE